jgi:transglutaminase-like putative cysteine protease
MKTSSYRWTDFISIGLLIGIHWALSQRLFFTNWDDDIFVLENLISLGTVLGFLLGYSKFNVRTSLFLSFAYGAVLIPWQFIILLSENVEYLERLTSLYGRLSESFWLLGQNLPLEDSFLFLLMMALIIWCVGISAAFQLIRNASPWPILLTEGVFVLIIEYYNYYQTGASWFSAIFFMLLLMLLGRLYFLKNRLAWQELGVKTDSEVGFDMSKATLLSGLLIIIFAWGIPSFTEAFTPGSALRDRLGDNWQNLSERFSNLTSPLSNPDRLSSQSFENTFMLGTGTELGDSLVLELHLTQPQPESARFYWRSQIFDKYSDDQWRTTHSAREQFGAPEKYIPLPGWLASQKVEFAITSHIPLTSIVFAPALPYSVSRPFEVIYQPIEDNLWDVAGVYFQDPISAGEIYYAASSVSTPSITQLRVSSSDYPEWIREYYLQLPDDFSQLIGSLALEITQSDLTNYDRAASITQYLRNEIIYKEVIPSPPARSDPIEWFLFESKSGFCNYYATAEILLLRSIGIPARLVIGYAQGKWDSEDNTFLVYQRDGHAWPEVFFPDIGWVEFEPTVSQPRSTFPIGPGLNEDALEGLQHGDPNPDPLNPFLLSEQEPEELKDFDPDALGSDRAGTGLNNWGWLLFLGLIAIGIVGLSIGLKRAPRLITITTNLSDRIEKRGLTPPTILNHLNTYLSLNSFERIFVSIKLVLWLYQQPTSNSQTSAQQVDLITQHIPEAAGPAQTLLDEYHKACFSPHPADIQKAKMASTTIISISVKTRINQLYKKYILGAF